MSQQLKVKRWRCCAGIILCMRPTNERWRYTVTPSFIGWAHTQCDSCCVSWDLIWLTTYIANRANQEKDLVVMNEDYMLFRLFFPDIRSFVYQFIHVIRRKLST